MRSAVEARSRTRREFARLSLAAAVANLQLGGANRTPRLFIKCSTENDLYKVVRDSGVTVERYASASAAVERAVPDSAVLVLADGYPERTEPVDDALFAAAAKKRLRMYVEFPAALAGVQTGDIRVAAHERGVVASDLFAPALPALRILALHRFSFVEMTPRASHIVAARVAGFDRAVYGIPDHDVYPLLFTADDCMIAATKLSNFAVARYGPVEAWTRIWTQILKWLTRSSSTPEIVWTPQVRPAFSSNEPLPRGFERQAVRRAAAWYFNSRMLIDSSWQREFDAAARFPDRVGPAPRREWSNGDGSSGLLEGFASSIHPDGSQDARWWIRADCTSEASFALAFAGAADNDKRLSNVAAKLNDFVYLSSILQSGPRAQTADPSFGLLGWNTTPKYWRDLDGFGVYYGDDNARCILATLGAAAVMQNRRWTDRVARCILANFRTTGRQGFRGNRIDHPDLEKNGWRYYFDRDLTHFAPHYEAYLWAVNLWAYRQSGYAPFLERTKIAVRMTMDAYPREWQWTNGLQQERARMLLPLAWLVRLENTAEYRGWLRRIAADLIAAQDASGAIREELGPAGKGDYGPPKSNEAYGASESTLIQQNGDPVTDLLYTGGFALFGLHEAAAATGDTLYTEAENQLAAFLTRVQVRSERHPEFDGGWFRAFDFRRWEYWASNADSGWGAWCLESGWSQAWITSVLALRDRKLSYWELTRGSDIKASLEALIPTMLHGA